MSKTIRLFLIALLTIGTTSINCQIKNSYKGIILDAINQTPVIGATIYNDSLKLGTVTNENGEFILNLCATPKVKISHLSYKPQELILNNENNSIHLEPSEYSLSEVIVDNNTALKLVRKANEKALADTGYLFHNKAFYQKISKINNDYSVIHEFFFDAAWNSYGVQKWNITNARYAQVDSLQFEFNNFTLAVMSRIGMISNPLNSTWLITPNSNADIETFYNFKIESVLNKETDDEIIIINCIPKDKYKDKAYFAGKLYIKSSTYQICQIQGTILNFFRKKSAQIKKPIINIDIVFNTEHKQTVFSHGQIELSLALISKTVVKKEVLETASVIFYQYTDEDVTNLKNLESENDTKLIKGVAYNPEFWQNNEVIKRTPVEIRVIKSFEEQHFFGNYFSK